MNELLEIRPQELKFSFELRKQSTCQVHLINNSDQLVAYKVKTTSPRKYSVRPNTGIIPPKSTCDFIVTMQAQRVAPPDMQCKDKFLIQSTVVPFGTSAEDITSCLFSKEDGRYVEENKLKVVLVYVSPPDSPVLHPINGCMKLESANEHSNLKVQLSSGIENLPPSHVVSSMDFDSSKEYELTKEVEELKSKIKDLEFKLNEAENTNIKLREEQNYSIQERDVLEKQLAENTNIKLREEQNYSIQERDVLQQQLAENTNKKLREEHNYSIQERDVLKQQLAENTNIKLREEQNYSIQERDVPQQLLAENTSIKLREEQNYSIQERDVPKQQLASTRRKPGGVKVQVGYPFLFVCFVAILNMYLGYTLRG